MRVKHILSETRKEKMAIIMQSEKKQKAERLEANRPNREALHHAKQFKPIDLVPPSNLSAKQEKAYADKHRVRVEGKVTVHRCL
jgi:hypothetical protein